MGASQPIKRRPGGAQQRTTWKGFHGSKSANQSEARKHTATHKLEVFHGGESANQTEARGGTATHNLEGISWGQVSQSNGGQEAHNSQPERDFIGASQPIKRGPGGSQQLTAWKGQVS